MTTPDLAAIVRKLTPAQRQYVEALQTPYGRGRWPVTNSLRSKGLMDGGETEICCGSIRTYLDPPSMTPLGLAVRAHLLSETNDV